MQTAPSPPLLALGALLHQRLASIPCLHQAWCCALLNHPGHGNLGDHLIWAGQLHYLEHTRRLPVRYAAGPADYAAAELRRAVADQPIVLSGGGQLGDMWPQLLAFIERVVRGHPGNPLVIFPQSLHFSDEDQRRRASATLQAHPDLTLVLRDEPSFQLAQRHFSGCRLILAPDMAFALPAGLLLPHRPLPPVPHRRPWLALRRLDRERASTSRWEQALAPWRRRVECTDWLPLQRGWIWGDRRLPLSRTVATGVREVLQRRLLMPRAALARHQWQQDLPAPWRELVRSSSLHRLSLGMVHEACRQLAGRELVISDRLHAVVLASLLGVPALALDNGTGKVHAFLNTWSSGLPLARAITVEALPQHLAEAAAGRAVPAPAPQTTADAPPP
jgi:exopolysaccharide biosynthesis predicted pyruvyltransferase EpsI